MTQWWSICLSKVYEALAAILIIFFFKKNPIKQKQIKWYLGTDWGLLEEQGAPGTSAGQLWS